MIIIFACFDEDMPYGDITTESVISDGTIADVILPTKVNGGTYSVTFKGAKKEKGV